MDAGIVELEWPADKDGLPLYSGDLRVIDAKTKQVLPGLTAAEVTITAEVGKPLILKAVQLTVKGRPYRPGEQVPPDQIGQSEVTYRIAAMRIREKT